MKATGIVRRIDDLGRIVIPKETRRMLRMDIGSSVEIYVNDHQVILQKYTPMKGFGEFASGAADGLEEQLACRVLLCDDERWMNGRHKGSGISFELETWIDEGKEREGESFHLVNGQQIRDHYVFVPIEKDKRAVGAVFAYGKNWFDEGDKKAIRAVCSFISSYLNS